MFKLGLKKHIAPHSKLSQFCTKLNESYLSEFQTVVHKDETYIYSFSKKLPLCEIVTYLELKYDLKSDLKDSAKIFVRLGIYSKLNRSNLEFFVTPHQLRAKELLERLNQDVCFREFYSYQKEFKSWNIISDEYHVSHPVLKFNINHSIISPVDFKTCDEKFNLFPALIKYNEVGDNSYIKRYDFYLLISYKIEDILTTDQLDNEDFFYINKLLLKNNDKEIAFNIQSAIVDYKNGYYYAKLFSTENHNEYLMVDLTNLNPYEIRLFYDIGRDIIEYKFLMPRLKQINEVWEIYKDLMSNYKH